MRNLEDKLWLDKLEKKVHRAMLLKKKGFDEVRIIVLN
jgi:hypothetical protein